MAKMQLTKILLIDDEPDIQEVVRIALEAVGGYTVETAGSGDEALKKVSGFAPQLILLDVMMPGTDGPTLLLELRKNPQTKDTPVVFMTAKVQPHEVARYKELGAVDVVAKPLDPMTLSHTINTLWSRCHD